MLRCTGRIWKKDNPSRKDEIDFSIKIPDAQMIDRKITFKYSVMPYLGSLFEKEIMEGLTGFSHNFNVLSLEDEKGKGILPPEKSFIKVEGEGILFSTIKETETGDGIIVRLWNAKEKPSNMRLEIGWVCKQAYLVNLDEEKIIRKLRIRSGAVEIPVGAKKIISIKLCK